MTMIDRTTFVLYPYIDRSFRSWTLTAGGPDDSRSLRVTGQPQLLGRAQRRRWALDEVTVLTHRRGHQGSRARAVG